MARLQIRMAGERCAEGVLKRKEIESRKSVNRSRRVAATVDDKSDAAAPEFAAQSALSVDSKGQISFSFRRNGFVTSRAIL